jgi:quinol monooxygenase YgiN
MIHVIATIELAPGTREKFLTEFRKNMPNVHAEPGCIEYAPAIDATTDLPAQSKVGPDKVVVVEKWASLDALKAHMKAPHMAEYAARTKDYVRGRDIKILSPA